MSVYVDDPVWPYGRMMMCHCFADTQSELMQMMDKIGVRRKWIQNNPKLVHFDICKTKRALAIKHGAIEVTRQQLSNFMKTGKI